MTKEKLQRINILSKKSKEQGLTETEKQEQATLRKEYIESIKSSLRQQLDNIEIV